MRSLAWLLFGCLFLCCFSQPALAERRVALVIGNGAYLHAPHLPNPPHDAEDVAAALRRSGFDTVLGVDLDKNKMEDAAINFARAARNADVAVFYYSGHAMQFAGVNYLIPIDLTLTDEADLRRATRVDDILDDLKQAKNLRILVLDSCRDNPLADQLKTAIGTTRSASIQRGLTKMESPDGTIISFSTQAGRTAADGVGRNSPYTTAFLKHIEEKEEISTVFHHISADVYDTSNGGQVPELSLSFFGEFYLNGKLQITVTPGKPAPADPCANASDHWKAAESIGTAAAFEDHLTRYGNCPYAGLARARIDELKNKDKGKQSELELTFWNSIRDSRDPVGFKDYLNRFPDGVFAGLARERLAALAVPDTPPAPPSTPSTFNGEISCNQERSLKSMNANRAVSLTFRNQTSGVINAFWLDYSGKRVLYKRMNAGESLGMNTYVTHPWVFADAGGQCRMIVLPDPARAVVSIR